MAAKKAVPAGIREFMGGFPAVVLTQKVSLGEGSTYDVPIDGTGTYNLLEIAPGMHIIDIKVEKNDGIADSGTGTSTMKVGDTGDDDRYFQDTHIKPDASGHASLAVDGSDKSHKYDDTTPAGQYISAIIGGSDPTDGEFVFTFLYTLEKAGA